METSISRGAIMGFTAERPESTLPINLESKLKPRDMMSFTKGDISDSSYRKELMDQLKVKCEDNLHHLKGKILEVLVLILGLSGG